MITALKIINISVTSDDYQFLSFCTNSFLSVPAPEISSLPGLEAPSLEMKFLEPCGLDGQYGHESMPSGPRTKRTWVQILRAGLCDLRGQD